MILNKSEVIRYNRHFTLPKVGQEGQLKLKAAKVLCIGAGGLGSPALLYLAAAGIGTIGIIDDDVVELSNLQRQILYKERDCGRKKVQTAKEHLISLNPAINVDCHDMRLTEDNALSLISKYDLIIDGTDNLTTRYIANDACFYSRKPFIYSSIYQFEGQVSSFMPGKACYRCLFPVNPPPELISNCSETGVFGLVSGLLGCVQAAEAIKLILNIGQPLIERLLIINSLNFSFSELIYSRNEKCNLCGSQQQKNMSLINDKKQDEEKIALSTHEFKKIIDEKNSNYLLVDVREKFEYEICNLNGILIPLNDLYERFNELEKNKHIIFYCKAGIRSMKAAKFLIENNYSKVSYLEGGIDLWREEIDMNLEKY